MKIGIIAGQGDLPFEVASSCVAQSKPYFMLGLADFVDETRLQSHPSYVVKIAHVGEALKALKDHQVTHLVLAGGVTRPSLRSLIPDAVGAKWLTQLLPYAFGDDRLLKTVVKLLEKEGFQVIGAEDILGAGVLAGAGLLAGPEPDKQVYHDSARGLEVLNLLSQADVGQAVVVQQGIVLGVEAVEGTAELISRCGALQRPGPGGVLVKRAKIAQEMRVDRPAIGPETIRQCYRAGVRAIALGAREVIILNISECQQLAQQYGITLIGVATHA